MTDSARLAVFQVILPGDQAADDPLGLWQAVPSGTSFAVGQPEAVVWRADLPSDPLEAANALQVQAAQQRLARQAMQAVPYFLSRDLGDPQPARSDLAFGIELAGAGSGAAILDQARMHAAGDVSFSVLDDLGILDVTQVFRQFIDQVQRMLGQLALVESAVDGRTAARTRVAWSGDFSTWWAAQAAPVDAAQHNQFLMSALSARRDWVRFVTLLTSLVMRISLALALNPFNPIAIWTTWKYVQEILTEYHRLRNPAGSPVL